MGVKKPHSTSGRERWNLYFQDESSSVAESYFFLAVPFFFAGAAFLAAFLGAAFLAAFFLATFFPPLTEL
jgi:hypothetical protein